MQAKNDIRFGGELNLVVGRRRGPEIMIKDKWIPDQLRLTLGYDPKTALGKAIRDILKFLPLEAKDAAHELIGRLADCVVLESKLSIITQKVTDWMGKVPVIRIQDYGVVGTKVITDAGVGFLVDAWQNLVELEAMKFHGLGTGTTAEAAGDTALVTELTTEYNPNSTRATGSLAEGATANIFRSIATNTLDGTPGAALREHGLFSASAAGVLWDRTLFGAITLSSGDSLQSTYDMTATSGG